jgi:hypothetical protein
MARDFSEFERGTSTQPHYNRPVLLAAAPKQPSQKKAAVALINAIRSIHADGEGEITLMDIVKMTGLENPPAELKQRGSITLAKTRDSSGRFQNAGKEIKFNYVVEIFGPDPEFTVTVPATLAGNYRIDGDSVTLDFEKEKQITAAGGNLKFVGVTVSPSVLTPKVTGTGILEVVAAKLSKPVQLD